MSEPERDNVASGALLNASLNFVFADISRLFRQKIERLIGDKNLQLSQGEIRTLAAITATGPQRQCDLAATLGVEPMTISAALDRLERRGLIARRPHPVDRRVKVIAETDAARDLLKEVAPLTQMVIDQATRDLCECELQRTEVILKKIRANLESTDLSGREAPIL
ncbi:transcriptional regulator [Aureimonas sp. SA4125]|nr:transcriptional regulator [Aureimonas sp. SA4125]